MPVFSFAQDGTTSVPEDWGAIKDLGQKGEEFEVKEGYARNFLFPRKLAVLSDTKEGKKLLTTAKKETKKPAKETIAAGIGKTIGESITLSAKASSKGKLYKAISKKELSQKFNLNLKDIVEMPKIETIGEREIEIKFKDNSKIKMKVTVSPTKNKRRE